MPMIRVECPFCGFEGKANLKLVGSEVGCRECGERFEIPLVPVMSKKKEGSGVWKPIDAGVDINALAELERSAGAAGPVTLEDTKKRRRQKKAEPAPPPAEAVIPKPLSTKAEADPFAPPADPTRQAAMANQTNAPTAASPAASSSRGKGVLVTLVLVAVIVAAGVGGAAMWLLTR